MRDLQSWAGTWLEVYKRRFVKESTFLSYKEAAKHIYCDVPIDKVTLEDLQGIINRMVDKGLSLSTIKHTLTIIRQSLARGRRLGYCQGAIDFHDLELPRAHKKRIRALTGREQRLLLVNAAFSNLGDLFLFLLLTGTRIGEAIALRWSDVDQAGGVIRISRTVYRGKETAVKTDKSDRVLPLTVSISKIIGRRRTQGGERVFSAPGGATLKYRNVLRAWHAFCERYGISRCGLHTLRHTYATNALAAGVNSKYIAELLGHSDVTVTLNIYADAQAAALAAPAEAISEYTNRLAG